jgi:hypothetical protein
MLNTLHNQCWELTKIFNIDSSINEMKYEYKLISYHIEKKEYEQPLKYILY